MAAKKGNILPKKGNLLPIVAKPSSATTCYEQAIARALRRELGGSRKSEKTLMRWTGARGRTVKNWISGLRGPSGSHLVGLMQNSNEVFKAVLIMTRRQDSRTPDGIRSARAHLIELLAFLDNAVETIG